MNYSTERRQNAAIKALRDFTCPNCGKAMRLNNGAFQSHRRYCESDPAERFWAKVEKTDSCWLWTAARNTTGYGMASWKGKKNIVAHRLAYELLVGPIPVGKLALHKCDTPHCVNPDHLFFGTDADNRADCVAKDRHARGERSGVNKLTEAQVKEIKRLIANGMRLMDIAPLFGVSKNHISGIKNGRYWRHLEQPE